MIIKDAQCETCKSCGSEKLITEEIHGCDCCHREISSQDSLELTVFNDPKIEDEETEHFHFCCWKCVFEFLPNVKANHFVNLPWLHYDAAAEGCKVEDFLQLVNIGD